MRVTTGGIQFGCLGVQPIGFGLAASCLRGSPPFAELAVATEAALGGAARFGGTARRDQRKQGRDPGHPRWAWLASTASRPWTISSVSGSWHGAPPRNSRKSATARRSAAQASPSCGRRRPGAAIAAKALRQVPYAVLRPPLLCEEQGRHGVIGAGVADSLACRKSCSASAKISAAWSSSVIAAPGSIRASTG